MLANPAADLAVFLAGRTLGGVALSATPGAANLFVGPMRPGDEQTPSPAVFLLNTGGPSPVSYIGGVRAAYFRPTVQVLVRGASRRLEAGEALARALYSALHLATVPMAGGGTYVSVEARDSAPAFLSEDDSRRPLWSLNFECHYRTTTG